MTEKKARKISWILHFFNDLSLWFVLVMAVFVLAATILCLVN